MQLSSPIILLEEFLLAIFLHCFYKMHVLGIVIKPKGELYAGYVDGCVIFSAQTRSLAPSTPLTGRRYLKDKEVLITPVSSATQSVSRLQSMVSGLCNVPTNDLLQIFK